MADSETLHTALQKIIDPVSGQSIVALDWVRGLTVRDNRAGFVLEIPITQAYPLKLAEALRTIAEHMLLTIPDITQATVVLTAHTEEPRQPQTRPQAPAAKAPMGKIALPQIRHLVAIASGKGGVGKSTVATGLALALAKSGLRVGLLDADIYGPSAPTMLGLSGQKPVGTADKKLLPLTAGGVQVMSIGLLVDASQPIIWRGPMVMGAIEQMLRDVAWPPLDILIIDLPPGTGDAQLTMAQRVPLNGAIIVSTPQEVALADARKGLKMFQKMDVPIIGLVENMSYFTCDVCHARHTVFASDGMAQLAASEHLPLLARLPLLPPLRIACDTANLEYMSEALKDLAAALAQTLQLAP